jgi:hypothetical protein
MPENNTYRETPPFFWCNSKAGAVKNNKIKKCYQ